MKDSLSKILFPVPRSIRMGGSPVDLGGAEWIRIPGDSSARLRARAMDCARDWAAAGRPVRVGAGRPGDQPVLLDVEVAVKGIPSEGYRLRIGGDGARLESSDEAGAWYGLLTFGQLFRHDGASLPAVTITDHPDFPARGIMLDVSRCKVPTLDTLKRLIDRLAGVKINQLQLYIEHTFAFVDHRTVWQDASPLTPEDVMELDRYCSDRFVDLVPNFNSFGHFERWLRHPEYKHLAECPDGFTYPWGATLDHGTTLRPDRASLRLLEALYEEFLPNFTSTKFNVGCDETWELGLGRSRKKCEHRGTGRVYLEFLKKIHRLVGRHDRTMMFWCDIIQKQPDLVPELPEDVIGLNWGYEADHPYSRDCRAFAQAGVPFYVCPGTSSWRSLVGRTENCLANLRNAARHGSKYGATGYLVTDWGDGGHHQVLPVSYLGYAASAANAWCVRSNADTDMAGAASHAFFGDRTGVSGQLFADAGRLADRIPFRRSNRSIVADLLECDLGVGRDLLKSVDRRHLRDVLSGIDDLEARIGDACPSGPDAPQVLDELRLGLSMARHAVHRGLLAKGVKLDGSVLRREILSVISAHEKQWLLRNRVGGLHESSGHLRRALSELG